MSQEVKSGIRLIAEMLDISPATVSRALREETAHLVKEARRKQIIDLADRMQFRPNPGARLLQKGLNPLLAVVIPSDEDVFFSEYYGRLMSGMLHAVAETDWDIRIATLNKRTGNYHRPLVVMKSVIPPEFELSEVDAHLVGVENTEGAFTAAKYLTQLGHKKIGILTGPATSRDFVERRKGYFDGLESAGIKTPGEYIYEGSYDHDAGREGCEALLSLDNPPTALLCANDAIALGALDIAKELGRRCPDDLSIIGFDDGPWAQSCNPKLSTIRQPLRQVSERCINILMKAATKVVSASHRDVMNLQVTLTIRDSTSVCRD
jgi:DNA-binding LacI/PurR family transcriptional regulator